MPSLFDPLKVGDLDLPSRVIMAPLTRLRATVDNIPTPIMVEYYTQRASAGLIISEATPVAPMGVGYAQVPGIWSEQQVEAWKPITAAVHAHGGLIVQQLWHVGRISDPVFLHGELPIAPSAIAPSGHVSLIRPEKPFVTPRALETREVPGIVEQFRRAAQRSQRAGFDGVEIHGANGYLIDQFLQSGTNHRTDEYGGSIANRARLMLEITDACISVWGASRVGMHLAPRADAHGISDANLTETFGYVAHELGRRQLAFLMSREHRAGGWLGPELKQKFGGVYIANEQFTFDAANDVLTNGEADAIAFGKLFIANPDLPSRFAKQAPLNEPNPATFYGHGPEGYIDQPSLQA